MNQQESSRSCNRMQALRRCWHPVAYAHAIKEAPHAATLLGVPLVLWRDANGRICVLRDACVHRGTVSSLSPRPADETVEFAVVCDP